jgi:hypothetical protein
MIGTKGETSAIVSARVSCGGCGFCWGIWWRVEVEEEERSAPAARASAGVQSGRVGGGGAVGGAI